MCKGPEAEASLVRQSWEELGDRAQWLVGRSWVSVGMAQRGCVLACYNSCWVCVCFIRLFDLLRGPHQNIMWNLIVKCWPRIQSHSHFTGGQNIPFPTRPDINLGRNPPEIKTYAHRNIYGAILRSRPVGESRSPQMCPSARGCRDVPGAPAQRPAHRELQGAVQRGEASLKGHVCGTPPHSPTPSKRRHLRDGNRRAGARLGDGGDSGAHARGSGQRPPGHRRPVLVVGAGVPVSTGGKMAQNPPHTPSQCRVPAFVFLHCHAPPPPV